MFRSQLYTNKIYEYIFIDFKYSSHMLVVIQLMNVIKRVKKTERLELCKEEYP